MVISESNVAVVARAFELFFAGDLLAGRELFAPDVIVIEDGNIPKGATWYGHDGVWRWVHDELGQLNGLDDVRFEVEHLIDAGDEVIVLLEMHATHRDTQARVELEYAQVWTIRDGQVATIQVHLDRANAFASARVVGAIRDLGDRPAARQPTRQPCPSQPTVTTASPSTIVGTIPVPRLKRISSSR